MGFETAHLMRTWVLSAALVAAVLGELPSVAFAAPTPTPKAQPTATTPPKGRPAPTAVLPTDTPVLPSPTPVPPTATAIPTPTAQPTATATLAPTRAVAPAQSPQGTATSIPAAPAASVAPSASVSPTPSVSATPSTTPTSATAASGTAAVRGQAFVDANADGQVSDGEVGLAQVEIKLTYPNGLSRSTRTDDTGAFSFDNVAPGQYRVSLTIPSNYVSTTDAGQDIEVVQDADTPDVLFGLISTEAAGLSPDATGPDATADDEQIIALASVTSLPLRFAEGRDLMAQVQKRVLGDGLVWLGVPFRSQIDGGVFQYVNCGPASLTMVLAGFGLEVGPSQVRDYLNNLIDNFDTDLGTSLDVLSRIGREAGLTPMDLYSDGGGYRNWST
jgi:SdrD B-like domain